MTCAVFVDSRFLFVCLFYFWCVYVYILHAQNRTIMASCSDLSSWQFIYLPTKTAHLTSEKTVWVISYIFVCVLKIALST